MAFENFLWPIDLGSEHAAHVLGWQEAESLSGRHIREGVCSRDSHLDEEKQPRRETLAIDDVLWIDDRKRGYGGLHSRRREQAHQRVRVQLDSCRVGPGQAIEVEITPALRTLDGIHFGYLRKSRNGSGCEHCECED